MAEDKVEEIIRQCVRYCRGDMDYDYRKKENIPVKKMSISEATTSIKELMLECVGSDETIPMIDKNIQMMGYEEIGEILQQRHKIYGYNQAKAEIREAIKKI